MAFKKPGFNIKQEFLAETANTDEFLPTILLGERYDIANGDLGDYDGNGSENEEYAYPGKDPLSVVDRAFTKLYFKNLFLKYYNSDTEGSVWRKIGSAPNKIRTLIANGLNFISDANGYFPHSDAFGDRGVKIDDSIIIESGSEILRTKVIGFEADKSTSSYDPVIADSNNQAAQSNSIGSALAGPNSGSTTAASNTGGTYLGSLEDDVIHDVYTVRISQPGTKPVITRTSKSSAAMDVSANEIYNFPASEIYTITITLSGAPGVGKFVVTSASGLDNMAEQVTPALDTFVDLGARGSKFKFTGTGNFIAGEWFIVSASPSSARIQITTQSGTDQSSNKIFPGFGTPVVVGRGLTMTFTAAGSENLVAGDYWTSECYKAIQASVATVSGLYSGPVDINYIARVIQGGEWGKCAVKIISTYSDGNQVLIVPGAGSVNKIQLGGYELYIHFSANTQGGLVKDDMFAVQAYAAKDTAYRTMIVQDSIDSEADAPTIGSATYTGSGSPHNTATSGGTYYPSARALNLFASEIYTVVISTLGAYGVAKFTYTSSSGLDNSTEETLIPLTPGTVLALGSFGVTISFAGSEDFAIADRWSVSITKPNLDVKLGISEESREVSKQREENISQTAWSETTEKVTINSGIKLKNGSWSDTEALLVEYAEMVLGYRALHAVGAENVYNINSTLDIATYLGEDSINNPIARAAKLALASSVNHTIRACYPASADQTGWLSMLSKLQVRSQAEVYRMAVLTSDQTIIESVESHVNQMSSVNKWRIAYVARQIPDRLDVIGTRDSTDFTAVIVENFATPGIFDLMRTTNANFTTAQIGDKVEYIGNTYQVKRVRTATEIEIDPPLAGPQSIPSSVYVYHIPNTQEIVELYSHYAQSYKNRRILHMAPDNFYIGGELHPSYFATAILAGIKAGLPAHQSMTNYNATGISSSPDSLFKFSETDLDLMANGGNLIIAQDSEGQSPYIRHYITTDVTSLKTREAGVTESIDSISYGLVDIIKPFIGKYNLHTGVLPQISANIEEFLFRKTENVTEQAGPQITGYEIQKLEIDPSSQDTLIVAIRLFVPYPFNYADVTLIV